jgi:hypothetical protein
LPATSLLITTSCPTCYYFLPCVLRNCDLKDRWGGSLGSGKRVALLVEVPGRRDLLGCGGKSKPGSGSCARGCSSLDVVSLLAIESNVTDAVLYQEGLRVRSSKGRRALIIHDAICIRRSSGVKVSRQWKSGDRPGLVAAHNAMPTEAKTPQETESFWMGNSVYRIMILDKLR